MSEITKKKKEAKETASYYATNGIVSKRNKFGLRFDGKYRSQSELRFAYYLEEHGIGFEFEEDGFKFKDVDGVELHYIPDFFIPSRGLYIEIVNTMTKRLRYKIMYFQEQYPNKKLMLITKGEVNDFWKGRKELF